MCILTALLYKFTMCPAIASMLVLLLQLVLFHAVVADQVEISLDGDSWSLSDSAGRVRLSRLGFQELYTLTSCKKFAQWYIYIARIFNLRRMREDYGSRPVCLSFCHSVILSFCLFRR